MIPAPGVRRAHRALVPVAIALFVAGCGVTPTSSPSSPGSSPTPVAASPTLGDEASSVPPTAEPTATDTPAPSPTATGEPPATASPTPTTEPASGAARCTGRQENREFYAAVAKAVDWDVYCPVLPAGWYVDTGNFRLASGGRLDISYKGPVGQRIEIREGSWCAAAAGCAPAGTDAGPASIGDRAARVFDLGDGTWTVYVSSGGTAWEAKGLGMGAEALGAFTATFAVVAR